MFHLYQPDHIKWPVSVDLPRGGSKETFAFMAHFRVLDQDECDELNERHNALILATVRRYEALKSYRSSIDLEPIVEPLPCSYQDLASEVLCGWDEEGKLAVVDDDGDPIPFTEANKARMMQIQGAASAIFNAWAESQGKPSEKSAAKAGGFRAKN
jgi:hypothetical protein